MNETDSEGQLVHEPACRRPFADEEYDKAWAGTILANSLHRLEIECARTGHASLCHALEPVFYGDEDAGSYREIGERLGMAEGAVKVAAHRMRARLRGLIREAVMQTVENEEDLDGELRYLVDLFSRQTG